MYDQFDTNAIWDEILKSKYYISINDVYDRTFSVGLIRLGRHFSGVHFVIFQDSRGNHAIVFLIYMNKGIVLICVYESDTM